MFTEKELYAARAVNGCLPMHRGCVQPICSCEQDAEFIHELREVFSGVTDLEVIAIYDESGLEVGATGPLHIPDQLELLNSNGHDPYNYVGRNI